MPWFGWGPPHLVSDTMVDLPSCSCHAPSPCPCAPLLDHLIRLEKEGRGDGEAECFGGLEVNDQLELGGLLHRQLGGAGTFQNLVHVGGGLPVHPRSARPLGHEASPPYPLSPRVHHGQPVRGGEGRHDPSTPAIEPHRRPHHA